jgi:hypothetical protein
MSTVALIPVAITVVVLICVIASTTITVRQDRRRNAVFAARWAETLRRRHAITAPRLPVPMAPPPPLLMARPVEPPKQDAA